METEAAELDRDALCRALAQADGSLGFLLVFVTSLLLSFRATAVQRRGVCLLLEGREEDAAALPSVTPLRTAAAAMVVGALGFFLCLALQAMAQAGSTPAARRTAWTNLWAAVLSMAAGVLRLAAVDRGAGASRSALSPDRDLPG